MSDLRAFVKSYWDYYLEIEDQFLDSKKYVAFDDTNAKTFSVEYLKLYQAVCSEIDVVGKEIACNVDAAFKVDHNTNIKKWGYSIQRFFPDLKDVIVVFNEEKEIQPFKNWEYEIAKTKNGKSNLRIVNNNETITWWRDYNKVKHQRMGLVTGTKNFCLANQKNLILSFSALYAMESIYIDSQNTDENIYKQESRLFKMK